MLTTSAARVASVRAVLAPVAVVVTTEISPEVMCDPLVVSIVAEAANATPPVFVQVSTPVPDVEQSPDRFPLLIVPAPEKNVRFPLAGDPVTVAPPPDAHEPLTHVFVLD
jgi:hypothetical protein